MSGRSWYTVVERAAREGGLEKQAAILIKKDIKN